MVEKPPIKIVIFGDGLFLFYQQRYDFKSQFMIF
jgi:hypothetical protein